MKHISKRRITLQEDYNRTSIANYPYTEDEFNEELRAIMDEHYDIESDIEKGHIRDYQSPKLSELEEILDKILAYRESGGNWYHSVVTFFSERLSTLGDVYVSSDEKETADSDSESFAKYQEIAREIIKENYKKVYPKDDKNNAEDAVGGVYIYYATNSTIDLPRIES